MTPPREPGRLVAILRPTEVLILPEFGDWVIRLDIVRGMDRHTAFELALEMTRRWSLASEMVMPKELGK